MNFEKLKTIAQMGLIVSFSTFSCASLDDSDSMELRDNISFIPSQSFKQYAFKTGFRIENGNTAYATWSLCHSTMQSQTKENRVYMLIGQIPSTPDHTGICLSKLAQVFLKVGHSALILPTQNFANPNSHDTWFQDQVTASEAVLASYGSKDILQPPAWKALWLAEEASIVGGVLAKKSPNRFQMLIFEQGIFDLNAVLEKSDSNSIKGMLNKMNSTAPNSLEDNSLAYDFEKLPKTVLLYHGEKNTKIPVQQAADFATSLQSGNFSVKFVKLPELDDKIEPSDQYQILQKALSAL